MDKCYFGTYFSDGGEGIYESYIDKHTGQLTTPNLLCEARNSKYLICENNMIFTTCDGIENSGVAVYKLDGQLIDLIEYENSAPCYILKDKEFIYTVNYHEGSIVKLKFMNNRLSIVEKHIIKSKSGCHQIIKYNNRILVPCLLLDKIYIFDIDLNLIDMIDFPVNSGPRHGVFSNDNRFLYIVGELSDTLYTLECKNESLKIVNTLSLLSEEDGVVKESSAIRLSEDGKCLMISIRKINVIVMVDISKGFPEIVQRISSYGDHPRDILNILNDKYLAIANRISGEVVIVKLSNNKIVDKCSQIKVSGVSTIGIMR